MYISMKYEEKTKILVKKRSKSCLLSFFSAESAESTGFGFIFSKIPNFRTFQMESLWNFQLVVIKVTKQSCCHGNRISRIFLYHIWEMSKFPCPLLP